MLLVINQGIEISIQIATAGILEALSTMPRLTQTQRTEAIKIYFAKGHSIKSVILSLHLEERFNVKVSKQVI